jgi:hypothetical protein
MKKKNCFLSQICKRPIEIGKGSYLKAIDIKIKSNLFIRLASHFLDETS